MSSSCVHLASDLHLGAPSSVASADRERAFIKWMRDAAAGTGFAQGKTATELHLVGDIFDFWFEYKRAVPQGGVRLMGAIAELTDSGLPIHFHVGNHDMWTFGYLEEELGVQVHRAPIIRNWDGLRCMVGHGDGLGPGDKGYRRLKGVFTSGFCQKAFRRLHPDWGIALAQAWSRQSRQTSEQPFTDTSQEHLFQYCLDWLSTPENDAVDIFVFGHRHLPLNLPIDGHDARYLNCGDWIEHMTSVCIHNGKAELLRHR